MGTFLLDKINVRTQIFVPNLCICRICVKPATAPRSSFSKQAARSQRGAFFTHFTLIISLSWVGKSKRVRSHSDSQQMSKYEVKTNLRLLRALLRPADESVFIGLPVSEAINLRVRAQRTFIVNVAAANSANAPCVHRLTAVLYFSHISSRAKWLARKANVSELLDR